MYDVYIYMCTMYVYMHMCTIYIYDVYGVNIHDVHDIQIYRQEYSYISRIFIYMNTYRQYIDSALIYHSGDEVCTQNVENIYVYIHTYKNIGSI